MYTKSILRSLILDGGVAITDPVRLRDRLQEQAQTADRVNKLGTIGGGISIGCGVLMMSLNPGALLAAVSGSYAVYLGQRAKATSLEEKEFRFLSRHGRIINLLGDFAKSGTATDDEILSAYESLTLAYLPLSDQIVVDGQPIAAGEMMARLPQVIAAQRQAPEPMHSNALPVTMSRPTALPPSRLHEYAETPSSQSAQLTAPLTQGALIGGESAIAVLERTVTQQATIGLPSPLTEVTVSKPYSTFIIGMSGAGKDIALYNIMAALKHRHPTALYVGIDGKNHAGELPLWSERLYDRQLHISMLDRPVDYHPRLLALLHHACEFPGMVYVAFSELNGIAGTYAANGMKSEWGEVAHYLRYLALQGNAAGKFLLSTAQGLTLDELGITTATRANIQFLMVGNGSQFGFISSITANTTVFDRKLISDQNSFTAACSRSTALEHLPNANTDKGIGYFHTALNRWEPMPRLVNPGADRCDPIVSPPPTVQAVAIPDPVATVQAVLTVDEMDAQMEASIEAETVIDQALEMLYASPGKEFPLTKLCANRSQRSRLGKFLIEVLQDSPNIIYRVKRHSQIESHLFRWENPTSTNNKSGDAE
jgi:hypothetical protein